SLRLEGGQLPDLERLIREAEEANGKVAILEKILKLKNLKNKISVCENHLKTFPKELLESKIQATDWANYEQLIERRELWKAKRQVSSDSEVDQKTPLLSVAWIITSITLVLAAILFFWLTSWMRYCVFSVALPLGCLWVGIFRSSKQQRHLRNCHLQK